MKGKGVEVAGEWVVTGGLMRARETGGHVKIKGLTNGYICISQSRLWQTVLGQADLERS